MVHAGEEPLQNGQLPMSFILENERLRHWVGDGTSPSDASDDATWVLTSSFIILTMQSGFGLLEAGMVARSTEVRLRVSPAPCRTCA